MKRIEKSNLHSFMPFIVLLLIILFLLIPASKGQTINPQVKKVYDFVKLSADTVEHRQDGTIQYCAQKFVVDSSICLHMFATDDIDGDDQLFVVLRRTSMDFRRMEFYIWDEETFNEQKIVIHGYEGRENVSTMTIRLTGELLEVRLYKIHLPEARETTYVKVLGLGNKEEGEVAKNALLDFICDELEL